MQAKTLANERQIFAKQSEKIAKMNKLRNLVQEKFPDLDLDKAIDRNEIAYLLNEEAKSQGSRPVITSYTVTSRLNKDIGKATYKVIEGDELLAWSSLLGVDHVTLLIDYGCGTARITIDEANILASEKGYQIGLETHVA